jgi:hypothetical protein
MDTSQVEEDESIDAPLDHLHPEAAAEAEGAGRGGLSVSDSETASDSESESESESESDEGAEGAGGGTRGATATAQQRQPNQPNHQPPVSNNKQAGDTVNAATIVVSEAFAGPTALLVATKTGRQAIEGAATAWVARYSGGSAGSSQKMEAVGEMVTYMLQIAGVVSMAVSGVDIASEGLEMISARVEGHVKEKGVEAVSTGRGGKAVKDGYREMVDKVIRELGKRDEGLDFSVVDTLVNLSVVLSTSKIRELRKVAVMTAAQVSISLLYVAAEKHAVRESVLKQMEDGGSKKGKKASAQSMKAFQAQADGCGRILQEILSFSDSIFTSVFSNRFRDVDSEIRSTVVGSLGAWMGLYPSRFLSMTYLKYLGWALSDKDGVVRYAAVNAVRGVYGREENALQLEDFTTRFADRMEELMEDKEDYVAVVGTELVTVLVQKGVLGSARGRNVFNLLSDPSERLRVAAAELAAGMVKNIGKDAVEARGEEVVAEICSTSGTVGATGATGAGGRQGKKAKTAKNAKGSKSNSNSKTNATFSSHEYEITGVLTTLRSLAEARGQPNEPLPEQIVHFVISSLSEKLESLSDWALMVDWLKREVPAALFGTGGDGQRADQNASAMRDLATTFLCAVKAAVILPTSRAQQTKERKKLQMMAKQNVTLLLQSELEPLINKFQSDPTVAATLVRTVPLMMVDLYSLKKQDAIFNKLMETIRDVMFRHADHECVRACSSALFFCTDTGKVNTRDIARAVFSKAQEQALEDLQSAVELARRLGAGGDGNAGSVGSVDSIGAMTAAYIESGGAEESQELFTIKSALTHVFCLLEANPTSFEDHQVDLRSGLREILTLASEGARFPPRVVFDASRSLFLLAIGDTSLVHNNKDSVSSEEHAIAVCNIKDAVSDLSCALQAVILTSVAAGWSDVATAAAASLADLFTVFCAATLPEHLRELGYTPLDEDIDVFWSGMEAAVCDPRLVGALDAGGTEGTDGLPSAVEIVERVCCSIGIRQYKQLGAKLLSYWENPSAPAESSGAFRELLKKLKAIDTHCLTDVYLNAMRVCYQRYCEEVSTLPDAQRAELAEKAIQPFLNLSHKIATSQAALNATSTLSSVAEKAALWALEDTPKNLEFLQGASYFVVKVKGGDAASILDKLVTAGLEAGAPADTGDDLGDWELFYEYCDVLKAQGQKSKGGVLKKPSKSTPKSTGVKQKRRISFAMADEGDFEARVDKSAARERRRSRRESGSRNYRETQTDEVQAEDDDIVEF